MRLFHERDFPRPTGLCKSDEQECFTAVGRRSGVWLTSEPLDGPLVLSFEAAEPDLTDFEVTGPEDDARKFVVPFVVAREFTSV